MTNPPNLKKDAESNVNFSPYFQALLKNLYKYLNEHDMSLHEFSDKTDIPFETVRSIYYKKTNTCKIKTAVQIARQLGMSLDELTESNLVDPLAAESLALAKQLTPTEKELVHWFIKKTVRRHEKHPGKKFVTVMTPICTSGALRATKDYSAIDVTDFPRPVVQTAFFGVVIPCEHYMPHYCRGNILLVASDRNPRPSEHCVVSMGDDLYVAIYYEENGIREGFAGFDDKHILHVGRFTPWEIRHRNIQYGVCFGPVLLVNGEVVNEDSLLSGVNPRTAIGQRSDGAVLMLVIEGRQVNSLGATYQDVVDVLLSYGAVNACNLDGGSSSMMYYEGEYLNNCSSVIGIRPVPTTFLVLKEGVGG